MLNKEILTNKAKEAKTIKGNIYIVKIDKNIKIMVSNTICSDDFLQQNDLDYSVNLIIGLTPDDILKYDYGIYNGWETNMNNVIEAINGDYKDFNFILD